MGIRVAGRRRALEVAGGIASLALPFAFAASRARVDDGIDASCDAGVVRVVGRGYTGVWHGLDALVGAPLGMHAQWASVVSATLLGLAAYLLARKIVRALTPGGLGVALSVVAAALATLTFPAQREATLVSGSVLGALLVVGPVVLAIEGAPTALVAVFLGLALTYDVPVGVAALASIAMLFAMSRKRPSWRALGFALAGAAPISWMLWRCDVAPHASLDVAPFAAWMGEGAAAHSRSAAFALARSELGVIALAFAAVGIVASLRARVSRSVGAALVAMVAIGALSPTFGAPVGPGRFGGALIAALVATSVLAAGGMAVVVSAIANARVPLARASAAMIVLLEIAVPVRVADDAALAMSMTKPRATAEWNARVLGALPRNAIVLLPTTRLFLRARAAAATGALRADVIIVSTFGLGSRATSTEIAREPLLSPLVRDVALYGAPEEFSVSQLAQTRPLLLAFDARWDKRFARHLVPQGAFDRYSVEPRGPTERVKAFATALADAPPSTGISELDDATRDLLRARALAATATGEREYADAATAELRRIAPADRLSFDLSRRIASSHGPIEVRDLVQTFDGGGERALTEDAVARANAATRASIR